MSVGRTEVNTRFKNWMEETGHASLGGGVDLGKKNHQFI